MNRALDFMEEIVVRPDVSFDFDMHPGDIQLINNYCTFHSRTEFVDHDAPDKKRHMLRAWLSVHNSRPLPPWYIDRWGSVTGGDVRGGIHSSFREKM
jgi:alpha-ketoglutarate-dependent taurine dioxygenase